MSGVGTGSATILGLLLGISLSFQDFLLTFMAATFHERPLLSAKILYSFVLFLCAEISILKCFSCLYFVALSFLLALSSSLLYNCVVLLLDMVSKVRP